jgi:hypothetical protein
VPTNLDGQTTIPKDTCYVQCTGNYGKELDNNGGGISLTKFSVNNADYVANGTHDVWNPDGMTWTIRGHNEQCLALTCGDMVYVEGIMNNGANGGRGEVCDTREWAVKCDEICIANELSMYCEESVNPSGKHIPTAGWSLDPKVSPHQNPDGFYTFGYRDNCGNKVCTNDKGELLEVHLFSGLQTTFDPADLSEYTGPIKNLKSERDGERVPHYASCDTIKYTQFADGKGNREQKIGSPAENVRAHLLGSGDLVVSSDRTFDGETLYAFCRVPKKPTRFLRA